MGCDVQLLSLCLACVAIWGFDKILVNKKHFFIFMPGMWEPIVAALLDELPFLRKRRTLVYITRFIIAYQSDFISFKKRDRVMTNIPFSCIFAFLGGLSCCFPSGIFMFGLLNDHTANTILYFGFAEVIVVAWLYGVKNFLQDIKDMTIPMPRHEY